MDKVAFEKVAGYKVTDFVFKNAIEPAYRMVKNYFTIEEFANRFNFDNINEDEVIFKEKMAKFRCEINNEFFRDQNYVAATEVTRRYGDVPTPVAFTFEAYYDAYVAAAKGMTNIDEPNPYLKNTTERERFIEKYTEYFNEYDAMVAEYNEKFGK